MISRRRFLILAGAGLPVAGVAVLGVKLVPADQSPAAAEPSINYGGESCRHCRMVIDDPRFASALRGPDGEQHFDDIGCLVASIPHGTTGSEYYVHDFVSGKWLEATSAFYVQSASILTPMAYGLAAFGTRYKATAVAEMNGGSVHDWVSLVDHLEIQG
ncbi:MAG: nitrous oxide reductase accessory protein NosL [Dehalococcoidia bacterium]